MKTIIHNDVVKYEINWLFNARERRKATRTRDNHIIRRTTVCSIRVLTL